MTDRDRARLAAILGMLGSEFEGEQASAARQAEAFRKRHGLTWEQMLALPPIEPVKVAPEPDPAMAAQQARWAAEDAARKAAWKAPPPPPPRPPPRPSRTPPAHEEPTNRWNLNMFTLAVLIGATVLLRHFFG